MNPGRDPRPALVHWGVDSAVAFLLIAFLAWIIGFPLWVIIVAALILGGLAVPFTRDLESRMLEDAEKSDGGDAPGGRDVDDEASGES